MNIIAGCLVIKDNKILLVKEGIEDCGKWNIPAGSAENFEKITDAAIRETFEETGLKVKLTSVLPIGERIINDKTFISVRFVAEIISGEIKIDDNEIIDAKWFSIEEFEKLGEEDLRSYEFNKQVVKNYIDGKMYPVEIFDDKQYIN